MLARVMDTSDDWIRERSGVEARHYVERGVGTSDLGVAAARRALDAAGIAPADVDLVVFATMTPDHFFPGSGALLQAKLGLREVPCFDIRQQCVGFLYGLQLADAHIRAGLARTVLLVGAEIHTGFMPWTATNWEYMLGRGDVPPTAEEFAWNTRFRHLTVLFGDAGAAVVLRATEEPRRGIVDSILHTNGAEYDKLYVPGTGFKHRPYTDPEQFQRGDHIPVMDGRAVFKMATTNMIAVAQEVLARNEVAHRRRLARPHAPGQQAHQRVLPEGARHPRREGDPQHRALREHHRRHHPAPLGRGGAGRPHQPRRPRAACRLRGGDELGRDAPARLAFAAWPAPAKPRLAGAGTSRSCATACPGARPG